MQQQQQQQQQQAAAAAAAKAEPQYPPMSSPGEKAVKYMMLMHQVFVMLIAGIVLLSIGIYTATQTTIINSVCDMLGVYYHVVTYSLILAAGVVMTVASVFGMYGTVKNFVCLHLFYLIILLCLFVLCLVVCIVGFVFYTQLQDAVKVRMSDSIAKFYGVGQVAERNLQVTQGTDAVQKYFKCCGAHGSRNSSTSWYLYRDRSAWYQVAAVLRNSTTPYVPASCCQLRTDGNIRDEAACIGDTAAANQAPRAEPPAAVANAALLETGCFDAMKELVTSRVVMMGAVAITYMVLLLTGVVLGFVFARMLAVMEQQNSKYSSLESPASPVMAQAAA